MSIDRSKMTQTDMKGKVLRAPKDNSQGEAQNFKWWLLEEKDMAAAVQATIKHIKKHQADRLEQLTNSTQLYGNSSAYGLLGASFSRASSSSANPLEQRLSFNVISSVVDTLTAKMAKNKVIPTFVTNGAVWKYQKKAKQLTKFAQGLSYQLKLHELCIDAFRDGCVWGDGFLHVFRKGDKVAVERVLPHEFEVDLVESLVTEPTQLHRVKICDRGRAKELFPELQEDIDLAEPVSKQEIGGQATAADLIQVTESWHLRSGEDAEDGVHAITIGEGAIVEKYERDYFPFAHFRYSRKMLGWYSQGAPERLQNIQREINRCMISKQRAVWLAGTFKILVEAGSKIVDQHFNNNDGTIIKYVGTPPQYITPPATNPELQEWIEGLIQKAFLQEGVSQLSASGQKPIGVDSGKAMRTLTDIEDDRFTFVSQRMEELVLDVIRQAIDVVKDIHKDKKSYPVTFPATNFLETVDWKDINLDEECYVLKAYPTSSLADDLTGRLSDIQEMMQAGLISPRTGRRLMNMPDVEMNENLSNAAEDLLHKVLEEMIYDGKYRAPEAPFWDLELAQQLVLDYYNYAQYMNAPQEVLADLERFNEALKEAAGVVVQAQQANAIAAQAQAQAQQAAAQPGQASGAPMANPEPTPTSDMIQNTNNSAA